MQSKVAILLLNWNGWRDTLECIESLLLLNYESFQIIVIDNQSDDGSVEHLMAHLAGRVALKVYLESDLSKPEIVHHHPSNNSPPLILIRNIKNHGFGGGNNVAITFVLAHCDMEYIWLLNNDTIVDIEALSELVKYSEANSALALVGSLICYYDNPEIIQAVGGGRFYPFFGRSRLACKGLTYNKLNSHTLNNAISKLNYLMGASILMRCDVIRSIGQFDSDYFLYSEDIDLSLRAFRKGIKLGVAPNSLIYHKDSASTRGKRDLFFQLFCKSTIICLRKNYSIIYLPFAALSCIFFTLRDGRKYSSLIASLRGMYEGFLKKLDQKRGLK